jgi:hypothetical protein
VFVRRLACAASARRGAAWGEREGIERETVLCLGREAYARRANRVIFFFKKTSRAEKNKTPLKIAPAVDGG